MLRRGHDEVVQHLAGQAHNGALVHELAAVTVTVVASEAKSGKQTFGTVSAVLEENAGMTAGRGTALRLRLGHPRETVVDNITPTELVAETLIEGLQSWGPRTEHRKDCRTLAKHKQ